ARCRSLDTGRSTRSSKRRSSHCRAFRQHQLPGRFRAFTRMAMMRTANPEKTAPARKVAVGPKTSHSQPARMLAMSSTVPVTRLNIPNAVPHWGDEHSVGHYLDFGSAILGLTLFPLGYLLHVLTKADA